MKRFVWVLGALLSVGCAAGESDDATGSHDSGAHGDAAQEDDALDDAAPAADADAQSGSDSDSDSGGGDATPSDSGSADSSPGSDSSDGGAMDAKIDAATDTSVVDTGPSGPLTGGPCASGAPGQTAFRVKFVNSGGHATVSYEATGWPDKSGFKVSVYPAGGSIDPSWYAPYDDMYLAVGGLRLDGTDFIDVSFSTVGISSITSVTLAIKGRSFAVSTDGSFSWQTLEGYGATVDGAVSNVPPYVWYGADATTELVAGKSADLLRIKAGPPSDSLIVSELELCMEAH